MTPSNPESPSLYELALVAAGGSGLATPPAPRPSAAVIPWRRRAHRDARGIEVFWVERSRKLAFMGGWHAFPGGTVARSDSHPDALAALQGRPAGVDDPGTGAPRVTRSPDAPIPDTVDDAPGVAVAALRELFEETGLLPRPHGLSFDAALRLRRGLVAGEVSVADSARQLAVGPLDASRLQFAGRWITPPLGPIRFDNRFFLLEIDDDQAPQIDPGELVAGEWIEPAQALARWENGEVLAAPPVLHILRVLAEEPDGPTSPRALDRLLDPREANLASFRRIEFRPGFLLFPLRTATLPPASTTNAFLVGYGDQALLFDPGASDAGELDRFVDALSETRDRLGRSPRAIVLTHHHPDHVGGVTSLAARLGLPVWAHAATARRLESRGIRVDRYLDEGDVLETGGGIDLRVIPTPGHASGHLAFHHAASGTVLVGDLVSGLGTVVIDPPDGNMDEYLVSLERVASLGARTLLPAHGPALLDPAQRLATLREHRLARELKILDAWQQEGLREPAALLDRVYAEGEVAPAARLLAERQIVAHLERLARQGAIDRP